MTHNLWQHWNKKMTVKNLKLWTQDLWGCPETVPKWQNADDYGCAFGQLRPKGLVTDWQKTENVHICTVIFYYSRSWYNLFLFEERNIPNIWTFTWITIIQNGFSIWGSNDQKWWIRSLVCTFFQYKCPSYCPYISAYLQ